MESNILDKNGIKVRQGDTLVFPYIDPSGQMHDEEDFRKKVVFKHGAFGYETETHFVPLMQWMKTERGDYVPNCGNKVVYTEKYPFWIDNPHTAGDDAGKMECVYYPDDTSAMNCKWCGKAKWLHAK